ncbi:MAG: threonine--tRNA ligase [Actinomycetota bacterium]
MDATELDILRHSTAHVMAQAVTELFGDVKLGIGPTIEDGFYYDFELPHTFAPDDLEKIEVKMREIAKRNLPITRAELAKADAVALFEELHQPYKVELLNAMADETVTVFRQGDFIDLCRGPHCSYTKKVKHFKLLSLAGAYWRGDEHRPMLQRIYGTAWGKADELAEYMIKLEEIAKRDHRKLGRELGLFDLPEELGPGLVVYHPKGAILRGLIEDFLKEEHRKRGYDFVVGPHIMKTSVWKTSGHLEMRYPMYFFEIEGQEYGIKPMNCPAHIMVYKSEPRSYRTLPIRYFELGTVYRHERSGVLHGLLRVRGFTQDDAHIFCLPEQAEEEILGVLDFAFFCLKTFGFEDYEVMLSTRPEKSVGSDENWEKATNALIKALEHHKINYQVDPGEGVFYGPKIDIKLKDALGRLWQGPTVQVDFNLPESFDAVYYGADNAQHRPVMIHRVVLGSMERFIGALIEHYGGEFPLWLAPVQAAVLPISEKHADYAASTTRIMKNAGLRVELDDRNETVSAKIRDSRMKKIPFALVVGDNEEKDGTVAVRDKEGKDHRGVKLADFISEVQSAVKDKVL